MNSPYYTMTRSQTLSSLPRTTFPTPLCMNLFSPCLCNTQGTSTESCLYILLQNGNSISYPLSSSLGPAPNQSNPTSLPELRTLLYRTAPSSPSSSSNSTTPSSLLPPSFYHRFKEILFIFLCFI